MAKTLDDAQLSELLNEMGRADSVELKLTVPDSDLRSAVDSLDLDPLEARMRQVVFFDTPELTLYIRTASWFEVGAFRVVPATRW